MEEWKDHLLNHEEAALATLDESGRPYASSVGYLFEGQNEGEGLGRIILFISTLAKHTKNISQQPSVSMMILEKGPASVHEKKRVSLSGEVERVNEATEVQRLKESYLKKYPKSEMFFQLSDFSFYQIRLESVDWYGGFGKAKSFHANNPLGRGTK